MSISKTPTNPGNALVLIDELCKKHYESGHLLSIANWPCEVVDEVEWVLSEK
jgi:hypothetical protein